VAPAQKKIKKKEKKRKKKKWKGMWILVIEVREYVAVACDVVLAACGVVLA